MAQSLISTEELQPLFSEDCQPAPVVAAPPVLRAMVYDGEESSRRAISAVAERAGSVVVGTSDSTPILSDLRASLPDLIVLELALAGERGLGIVSVLLGELPVSAVILLSPFETLRTPALEAGAYELVGKRDLRDLAGAVRRLAASRTPCAQLEIS
jgi:DNA-binding response OmpR family regulator